LNTLIDEPFAAELGNVEEFEFEPDVAEPGPAGRELPVLGFILIGFVVGVFCILIFVLPFILIKGKG
jgi:hypothetical protein